MGKDRELLQEAHSEACTGAVLAREGRFKLQATSMSNWRAAHVGWRCASCCSLGAQDEFDRGHLGFLPANNPQQSWGFGGEPPEAVMKDSGTRDGTL